MMLGLLGTSTRDAANSLAQRGITDAFDGCENPTANTCGAWPILSDRRVDKMVGVRSGPRFLKGTSRALKMGGSLGRRASPQQTTEVTGELPETSW